MKSIDLDEMQSAIRSHLPPLGIAITFIAAYILLDWASYIHPLYGLNITPWNPAPALALVLTLYYGLPAAAPLFVAILVGETWIRGLPAPVPITIVVSLLLTVGYTAMGLWLRHRFRDRDLFTDRSGMFAWLIAVVGGTLLISVIFVSAVSIAGLIPAGEWTSALVQFWIGDGVGIIVTMPLLWMCADERGRAMLRAAALRWETLGYVLLAVAVLWIAFGIGAQADFKYFYVLFLPIAWAAARQGFTGAVLGAALIQVGIIVAVRLFGVAAVTVLEIQLLALMLALMGFFIGLVVDEHRRVSTELRQSLRLAAAGEMAGALAHELNQPLSAVSAYGAACEKLLEQGERGERLRDTIGRMIAESFRAAEVVRRLRDFFRTGATRLERVMLDDVLNTSVTPFLERAAREQIQFTVAAIPRATLLADRMQLDVVLRNILANAFDAVAALPTEQRRVSLTPEVGGGRVRITVEDSGPGVSSAAAARLFEAFHSGKSSGLGLGLTISRAIAEAHGGSLTVDVAEHGVFKLVLPVDEEAR